MFKRACAGVLALAFVVSLTAPALSQDAMKKDDAKKSEMKQDAMKGDGVKKDAMKRESKKEMMMGPLKTVSCDDACGFMMRSRDEKELTEVVKKHGKKHHQMTMSDKDVMGMMKTEEKKEEADGHEGHQH